MVGEDVAVDGVVDSMRTVLLTVPFARFFNSPNIQQARRPSLVAVGIELLGVVGAARLECGEPVAEAGELIRRQLGDSFGDFFRPSCGAV